jgi:hypothetical protein
VVTLPFSKGLLMPKIPVDKLEPGMKLARPIVGKNGMVMLGEGTEITEKWIERIRDMEIASIFIDGPAVQMISKEEALANLESRFSLVEGKPLMNAIKKIVQKHIEGLYG